ncbi:MAG: hypothetical protein IH946_10175 [Bacteroidetes bacterium]|nr:hypothetical protein [Bacteroidota bacterium]
MSYEFNEVTSLNDSTLIKYNYEGEGALYQFYIGNGFRIKDLSIGVNVIYLFGQNAFTRVDSFPSGDFLNTSSKETFTVNGLMWNAGLQYEYKFKEEMKLIIGVNGSSGGKINSLYSAVWERFSAGLVTDTAYNLQDSAGNLTLPSSYGAGLMVQKTNNWQIGINFKIDQWSELKYLNLANPLVNSWKFSIGGEWIPEFDSRNFLDKMKYRFGVYYGKTPYNISGTDLSEYGMTFGTGLPLRKLFSTVNLTFDTGTRTSSNPSLLRETYFRFHLGFTLNDKWFIKRKFD